MTLKGQRVAIIGGTSGIAWATIAAGAAVTVASRRQGSVEAAIAEAGPGAADEEGFYVFPGGAPPTVHSDRPGHTQSNAKPNRNAASSPHSHEEMPRA
jgi:NAD(P)-dependent dehydrogenase (short-subunit alcohol dehydrogenase family)